MNSFAQSIILDESSFCNNFPLHYACKIGDVQKVQAFLQLNIQLVILEDNIEHRTPSHWAASFGQLDCLKQVALIMPNVINIQSSRTFKTPLHCAAESGHVPCVLWLLHAGANPNVKDNLGETALHKVARIGNAECVSLLIAASTSLSALNNNGQSACTVAEINGHLAIAEYLRKSESFAALSTGSIKRFCSPVHFNRKRNWDMMNSSNNKRMRVEEDSMSTMMTSLIEHEKLCTMEYRYSRSLLERMCHEFHGS